MHTVWGELPWFSNAFKHILLPHLRICSGPAADQFQLNLPFLIKRKYHVFYFQLTCGNLLGGLYPNFSHCLEPRRVAPPGLAFTCWGAHLTLGWGSCVHGGAGGIITLYCMDGSFWDLSRITDHPDPHERRLRNVVCETRAA